MMKMGRITPEAMTMGKTFKASILPSFFIILLLSSAIIPPTECLFDEKGSSFLRKLKSATSNEGSPSAGKLSSSFRPSSSLISPSASFISSLTADSDEGGLDAMAMLEGSDETMDDDVERLVLSHDENEIDVDQDEELQGERLEINQAHTASRHQSSTASPSGVVLECIRDTKFVNLGHDLQGAPVTVNVGRCRRRISFNNDGPDTSAEGKETRSGKAIIKINVSNGSCPRQQAMCHSVKERMERYYTLEGPLEIGVVQECACMAKPTSCIRTAKNITFFPETPYEQTMDVGECHGHCDSGNSCKPSRNRTVHVVGPNGSVGVEVIESCQCVSSCYRVTRLDVVRDYTNVTSTGEPRIREIDVGRCVGQCTSSPGYDCVMRSPKFSGNCLMSLYRRQQRCAPVGYMAHYFVDSRGERRTVLSVTDCSCF